MRLTKEKRAFQWAPEVEAALFTAAILAYLQPGVKFTVDTDGQERRTKERVISYYSKTLKKAERNYCVTRRELLAIVESLKHFHKYLYGQEFHLHTDHSALTWLMNFMNLEGQTVCWIQCLQEYNFTSEHGLRRKHNNAGALFRWPCQEGCTHCQKLRRGQK
jgi:hypothetical protein